MTEQAPQQLALLLSSVDGGRPEVCVTPIVHALAACALDCKVELHFAGPSVRLLVQGVADALYPTPQRDKSLGAFLREAAAAGVELRACSMARAAWIDADEALIPECAGSAGATAFIARSLDPEWRVLVY